MARQPLKTRLPLTGWQMGYEGLAQRPQAAALIGQCIAAWSDIELVTSLFLPTMLNAQTVPGAALYLRLGNARAKKDALDAVARTIFSEEQFNLYNIVMTFKYSMEKQRADLAHGLFGITSDDPDGVIWCSSLDRVRHIFDTFRKIAEKTVTISDHRGIENYIYHYNLNDFAQFLVEIEELRTAIIKLTGLARMVINKDRQEGEQYQLLLSEPLVQKSLSQSSSSPKND